LIDISRGFELSYKGANCIAVESHDINNVVVPIEAFNNAWGALIAQPMGNLQVVHEEQAKVLAARIRGAE
jgi:hypothetical protein